jgi:hypothetical protein
MRGYRFIEADGTKETYMLRLLTVLIFSIALSFTMTSADAKKRLPCGDYEGAPPQNDCVPVTLEKSAECQKWIDKGKEALDPRLKEKLKKEYIKCVRSGPRGE